MPAFKPEPKLPSLRQRRLERSAWVAIYAGLLALVLGYFTDSTQGADASGLYALGSLGVALGIVMVYLRSRMRDEP